MKKSNDSKNLKIVLALSLVILASVSVAYAILSTTLTITFSNLTQKALSWNVAFKTGNVNGTPSGTSATGRSCGVATVTADSVTIAETSLSKPDDKCVYELTIRNTGSIDAILNTITPTAPTSVACGTATGPTLVCGNITYKLTTDAAGNNLLATNSIIAHDTGTLKVYLTAHYTGSSLNSSDVIQQGAKFTLVYQQH